MIKIKYKGADLTNYNNFLNECLNKDYSNLKTHKHHMLPKFMGGDNSVNNILKISIEDHYIAHVILAECFDIETHQYTGNILGAEKILNDINKYMNIDRIHPPIKLAMSKETIRKMRDSKIKTGSIILKDGKYTFSDEVLKNMSKAGKKGYAEGTRINTFKNKSEFLLKRMAETRRKPGEFKHSEESKRKTSQSMKGINAGANNPMYGKIFTDEERKQRSLRMKGKYNGGKNNRAKKTKCNTTGMIFDCAKDVARYYSITYDVMFGMMKKGLFSYV